MISERALQLAQEVRQWCESLNNFPDCLEGACGLASYTLWRVYLACGIPARLAGNDGHCFVLVKSPTSKRYNIIVDLTATQFSDVPSVCILAWNKRQWFHDVQYLNRVQVLDFKRWYRDQQPQSYRNKIRTLRERLVTKYGNVA